MLRGELPAERRSFESIVEAATGIFGFVVAPTGESLRLLAGWLRRTGLKVRLVIDLYPACRTRQADLEELLALMDAAGPEALDVRVYARDGVHERGANALCFVNPGNGGQGTDPLTASLGEAEASARAERGTPGRE